MVKEWAREEAFLILNNIMVKSAYSSIEIRKRLHGSHLSKVDRALVVEIVNGTLRNLLKIDWILDKFININPKKITREIRNILRCGVYQIIFLDRIPDSAACNESAELAKKYGNQGATRFVNGVLRNISRKKETIKLPSNGNAPEFLSIEFSHPLWMVELWMNDYGLSFTKSLLKANNNTPPLTIRINNLRVDKEEITKLLESLNMDVSEGSYNDEAINVKGIYSLDRMSSFKNGYFQIQDESSMLVSKIVNPKPGDLIIDVCSAPGGKATHMAELMLNEGKVIARDIHKHKLKLIEENAKRLGIEIIDTQIFDARTIDESLLGVADAVVVDAPCSGLGLVRRKPDLRWKKAVKDLDSLPNLQYLILNNSSSYVKKFGTLAYSTCTMNKKENIQVVKRFLNNNDNFELDSISELLPDSLKSSISIPGILELFPHIHGTDGFFIAKMKRKM